MQACQVTPTQGAVVVQVEDDSDADAPKRYVAADPLRNMHIVLTRPHTVLLLATVTGGVAHRGAFTSAVADQIRATDGKTDICTMFCKAAKNLSCEKQCPEFRMTLSKMLALPPVINNTSAGN